MPSRRVRSACTATDRRPSDSISATVAPIVPGIQSFSSTVRAVTTTSAPSLASSTATTFPMPRLLPVTTATLPSRLPESDMRRLPSDTWAHCTRNPRAGANAADGVAW